MAKNPQLTSGEIDQCARNKNFNFSLLINGGKLIELIICSYEEFKQWIEETRKNYAMIQRDLDTLRANI